MDIWISWNRADQVGFSEDGDSRYDEKPVGKLESVKYRAAETRYHWRWAKRCHSSGMVYGGLTPSVHLTVDPI